MPVKNTAASTSAVSVVRQLYWRREVLRAWNVPEYPELGMECHLGKIEVEDFPAFIPCG